MSGHSKWSTIKRQKGANDAKRGALFTKVTREIMIAARQGGGDPDANYRLRLAVDKARRPPINMPSDNIKRAIDRATGGGDAEVFEEIIYEGYGPGGVAILVETQTDNRNRTAADVRSLFTKAGGWDLGQVDDPAFNDAVDDALMTLDRDEQARMWQALNRRAVEEAWVIPTFFGRSQTIAGTKVAPVYRWPAYSSWPYAEMFVTE